MSDKINTNAWSDDSKGNFEENVINYIEENEKIISKLNKEIELLTLKIKNQNRILDSYNDLFTYLYVFSDIKPKGTLKDMQDLCLELFKFIDNVCNKYKITYWLDFGSVLGSVRHEGFIHWDDDVDIGILKKDLDRFIEVMHLEIKNNGLDEFVVIREKKKYDNSITAFVQILYYKKSAVKNMLAGIDILPYVYLKNEDNLPIAELRSTLNNKTKILKKKFLENESFKKDPIKSLNEFNEALNIVDHEEKYIIASAVSLVPNKVKVYKTDDIFPVQRVKFGRYYVSSVRNEPVYLETIFGKDYMKLPKIVTFHARMSDLNKQHIEGLHELYREEILRLRKVNEKWVY